MTATLESRIEQLEERVLELENKKSVKPLVVIKVPNFLSIKNVQYNTDILKKEMTDYHILVVQDNVDYPKFEVFCENNLNKLNKEEFDNLLKNNFKNEKQRNKI